MALAAPRGAACGSRARPRASRTRQARPSGRHPDLPGPELVTAGGPAGREGGSHAWQPDGRRLAAHHPGRVKSGGRADDRLGALVPSPARLRARWTPRTQRSTPLRATWSASPRSTRAPATVRRRRVAAVTLPAGGSSSTSGTRPASRARMRKQNRSARNGRASPLPQPGEHRPGARSPPCCWVAAGRRRSVRRGRRGSRVLAAEPVEGLAEEAQLGRWLAATSPSPPGSAARSTAQGGGAQVEASAVSGWRPPAGRGAAPGSSSPSPPKWAMPGYSPMQTSLDPVRRHPEVAERGQDLGELELVVQVGLEPEQVVAGVVGGQGAVALLEPAPHRPGVEAVRGGEELGPDPAQPGVVEPGRDRPLVQDVGPGQRVGGQARRGAGGRRRCRRWSRAWS